MRDEVKTEKVCFSRQYSKLLYSHTKRKGNKVAHCLTRLAANIVDCVVWMEDIPQCIYLVI